MSSKRKTGGAGDYARSFSSEDGVHYRGHHQELGPAMRRVEQIRELQALQNKQNNPTGRTYIGSVPVTVLQDWLAKHNYTWEQWGRKEGTIRQEFMKYFLSREFSKLHVQHSTTRVGTGNRIIVPSYIGGSNGNSKLRPAEDGGQ